MRIALLIALVLALVGCGAGSTAVSATGTATTDLKITYWPQGAGVGTATRWTLRCAPAGGTLPGAGAACRKLGEMQRPFATMPGGTMCTQEYGGPQVAVIAGTFRGGKLWARLSATNGCEISRAKRLAFLVPGFASTSA